MIGEPNAKTAPRDIVRALGESPRFCVGDAVRVLDRSPIGHYRVPIYLRGRSGVVERVLEPPQLDNEREGFGLNAGDKLHYYRVVFGLPELWPEYAGSPDDNLRIEVFETWLEGI
ncbi:MAG: SH3-like domain-containing protein [Hyphomicrobium sp.]